MISRYDIYRAFEMDEEQGGKSEMRLDKENNQLISKETGEVICTVDFYIEYLSKKLHCDFEVIYSDHASLTTIYRCNECGTVVFGGDDERWDPNLKCPNCGEYKTFLKYWTSEDIENDPQKQKEIEGIIKMQEYMDECDKRHIQRGLYDWQLYKKTIRGKKYGCNIEFKIDSIMNKCKLKGLEVSFDFMKKEAEDMSWYTHFKNITIPLSTHSIYIRYIYPYSKKCHSDFRKYYFWQKKLLDKSAGV